MGGHNIYIPKIKVQGIKLGLLYNAHAFLDSRKLTSSDDWYVATLTEMQALADHLGADGDYATNTVGGAMKDTGTVYWNSPNTGATNSTGFTARGAGSRSDFDGSFNAIKEKTTIWSSTDYLGTRKRGMSFFDGSAAFYCPGNINYRDEIGQSVRFVSDATGVADGTTTTYTGNDGKIYNAIAINGLYWVVKNIAETKYRNGDSILEVTDNATWVGLTTGALCAYDNDWSNV